MKMLNHRNNYTDDLKKEREVLLNLAQQKYVTWHICRFLSNTLAWCHLVRKSGEWGRKVMQGTVSQAGARARWSFSREEWGGLGGGWGQKVQTAAAQR